MSDTPLPATTDAARVAAITACLDRIKSMPADHATFVLATLIVSEVITPEEYERAAAITRRLEALQ